MLFNDGLTEYNGIATSSIRSWLTFTNINGQNALHTILAISLHTEHITNTNTHKTSVQKT